MSFLSSTTSNFGSHNSFDRRDNHSPNTSIFMDGMAISLSLFSISAVCFVKYIILQHQQGRLSPMDNVPFYQRRRKSLHDLQHGLHHQKRQVTTTGTTTTKNNDDTMMMLSHRGKTALLPVIPYQNHFFAALSVRRPDRTTIVSRCFGSC